MIIFRIDDHFLSRQSSTRWPLTGEISLKIFGSPEMLQFYHKLLRFYRKVFLVTGTPFTQSETLFEILGIPEKTCLICTGTPVKTYRNFWQS